MRVIAGAAKGVRLTAVPAGTRPVSDRAREGLFSSLGPTVKESRVLDLFAGTGAMGIEALSRGAASAMFVDSAPAAVKVIAENLRRTRFHPKGTVRRQDVVRFLRAGAPGPFDLALVDPPYRHPGPAVDQVLTELAGQRVVPEGGRVVLTRLQGGYMPVIPLNWRLERRLSYGDTVVLVFKV